MTEPGLECILGRCDAVRAEVYFRATPPKALTAASLSGTLTGPESRRAITLPATARLTAVPAAGTAAGPAGSLVARAIVTEPAFWTPEGPSLYRLDAGLESDGRDLARWRRLLGLRRLGVRGRSLWLDGRRYVPRGLTADPETLDIAAFRGAAVAAVMADPSEEVLDRCDAEGLAVVARLVDRRGRPLADAAASAAVARWTWHPAVFVAALPEELPGAAAAGFAAASRGRKGTLLVALEVDGLQPPAAVPEGIDLVLVKFPADALPHPAWRTDPPPVPLLAWQKGGAVAGDVSRRGCDATQAALAAWGGTAAGHPGVAWAGYLGGGR